MTKQPLVSIAAINYNNSKYVVDTLESIRNQTYDNIELIIVDDCSTDDSVEVITGWLKNYTLPHKFIKHEVNKGVAVACNTAIKNATGKYYSAIATDDVMMHSKTNIQVHMLEGSDHKVGAVYSDANVIEEDGSLADGLFISRHKQFTKNPSGDIYETLLQGNYIPGMTFLFKRSVFDDVGLYDESLIYEDYDMWLRLSKKYRIIFSEYNAASYRLRANSLSNTIKNWNYTDARIFLKHVDAPLPMGRVKKIMVDAYSKGDDKTMRVFREFAIKTKNRYFKAGWLLWKYKVHFPTAEIILKRIDGYCSVSVSNWYIDLSIYKDILGAIKKSNSSFFGSKK